MPVKENIVVGLDIGTTKICAVVGEVTDKEINIIGIGTHPSIGLRKGVVVNIESTVDSIKKRLKRLNLWPDVKYLPYMQESPEATLQASTAGGLLESKDLK